MVKSDIKSQVEFNLRKTDFSAYHLSVFGLAGLISTKHNLALIHSYHIHIPLISSVKSMILTT